MTDNHFQAKHKSLYFNNISRLGIIGGMGIVASSKFHYDICQLSSVITPEQQQIQTVLISYPNIPDRTESITNGNKNEIVDTLSNIIVALDRLEVSHIVICCFTFHAILDNIDDTIKQKIVSLIDYSFSYIDSKPADTLILCTTGSANHRIFGNSEYIIYPKMDDQHLIHNCIIKLKNGFDKDTVFSDIKSIITQYEFSNILIGCTDLYVLSDYFINEYDNSIVINPLEIMKHDIVNSWINK